MSLLLAIVLLGAIVGSTAFSVFVASGALHDGPAIGRGLFGAAAMQSCGRGMAVPLAAADANAVGAFADFLNGRRPAIGCEEIDVNVASEPADPILSSSRYLIHFLAAPWSVSGPSWRVASWLAGFFYAVTAGFAYALARLGMARWIAVVVAATFLVSPLQFANIGDLRDYSKAPILMVTLFLCGLLVSRQLPARRTIVCAAIAGATIGIGYGMRTDAVLNLVAVIATVAMFLPGSLASTWKVRAASVVLALACFLASIGPLLVSRTGGYLWHWVVLGFADTFDQSLDIREAPYQIGTFYNDGYAAAVIQAFDGRTGSRHGDTRFGGAGYSSAGRAYFFNLVTTFPGDMATRACAALRKVLELPFEMARRQFFGGSARLSPDGSPLLLRLIDFRDRVIGRATGAGIAFAVLGIAAIAAIDLRIGLWVLLAVMFFGGYPSIQFQPRHVFHLEIIGLWMAGAVMATVVTIIRGLIHGWTLGQSSLLTPLARVGTTATVAIAATFGMTTLLRSVQKGHVEQLLAAYSESSRRAVVVEPVALDPDWVRLTPLGSRSRTRAEVDTELVVVRIGGTCDSDRVDLRLSYAAVDAANDHSRIVGVAVPDTPDGVVEMFLPLLRPAADKPFKVAGLDVRGPQQSCIQSVATVDGAERMPVVVEALLPSSWRQLTLAQTIEPLEDAATYHGRPQTITNADTVWPYSAVNQLVARVNRVETLSPEYVAPIASLGGAHALTVDGPVDNPSSYLAEFPPQVVEHDQLLVAEGSVASGGLTIGLTNQDGWRAAANVAVPGRFRVLVAPPEHGPFRIVVANNVRTGFHNTATVDRIGLVHVSATEGARP